ncbi:hypothetical protein CQ019_18020 [Arthrobacter sp. MYb229]|nr:hypothetical protein CQ019_18020 [Arthrobacter sp. MYb229]PRB46383.1 hypothetical protein CQ013_17995 [Arthrobacter sp. MYb216]
MVWMKLPNFQVKRYQHRINDVSYRLNCLALRIINPHSCRQRKQARIISGATLFRILRTSQSQGL